MMILQPKYDFPWGRIRGEEINASSPNFYQKSLILKQSSAAFSCVATNAPPTVLLRKSCHSLLTPVFS